LTVSIAEGVGVVFGDAGEQEVRIIEEAVRDNAANFKILSAFSAIF
jgi:hypothetical protein